MKKFIDPIPDGGAPMFSDTVLGPLFKDIYTALEGSLYGIASETEGVIVKGCVVTPNGGNFDCTSGIVYLNGQFMDFAGFTNQPATRYIVPASAVNSSFPFFDGGTKNLIVTQSATHQGSAPGSGQYIAVSNTSPKRLTTYISPQVSSLINSVSGGLYKKIVAIGDWNMDTTSFVLIPHVIGDFTKIKTVSVIIRTDDNLTYRPLNFFLDLNTIAGGGVFSIDSTNIQIMRLTGGSFDSADYDGTGFSRGDVVIEYLP